MLWSLGQSRSVPDTETNIIRDSRLQNIRLAIESHGEREKDALALLFREI
jgi:hypothetical protein